MHPAGQRFRFRSIDIVLIVERDELDPFGTMLADTHLDAEGISAALVSDGEARKLLPAETRRIW